MNVELKIQINKPTGKGTRTVGDKNETKQEEGKRNNKKKDVQGRMGGIPTQIQQRSMIMASHKGAVSGDTIIARDVCTRM